MRLYALGEIEWKDTQLFYHAMGHLGLEGVVVCRSSSPYYCVGFHQDVKQELDTEYLDPNGVPYFRRETGGGTVRLDKDQVYYQVIMHRDNPEAPPRPDYFCERYLGPAVEALSTLGLKGQMVPPNDILVDDRKISGNGGGQLGDCKVLVGDLLVDYDTETMCQGLRVPSEGFRQACIECMKGNVTTVKERLPDIGVEDVEKALMDAYQGMCEEGRTDTLPDEVHEKARELEGKMLSEKWLFHPGPKGPGRRVKIREGVQIAWLELEEKGWLHVEIAEGSLKEAKVISRPDTDPEETTTLLRDLLSSEEEGLHKGLRRTFQDMGLSREWAADLTKEVRARFL